MTNKLLFILAFLTLSHSGWSRTFSYVCHSNNSKLKLAQIIFPKHGKDVFEFDGKVLSLSQSSSTAKPKNRFCFKAWEGTFFAGNLTKVTYCADQDLFNGLPQGEIEKKASNVSGIFDCRVR